MRRTVCVCVCVCVGVCVSMGGDLHGHVPPEIVPKLHSGSYSWYQYTSAHQSLLLGETERYQGYACMLRMSFSRRLTENVTWPTDLILIDDGGGE